MKRAGLLLGLFLIGAVAFAQNNTAILNQSANNYYGQGYIFQIGMHNHGTVNQLGSWYVSGMYMVSSTNLDGVTWVQSHRWYP